MDAKKRLLMHGSLRQLSSSAVCFTLSTVSWNSRPVSAKRISNAGMNHAQEEVSQDYLSTGI